MKNINHSFGPVVLAKGKCRSFFAVAAVVAASAVVFATQAQAALVLGWDFENAAVGQISDIATSTTTSGFSAASFSTGDKLTAHLRLKKLAPTKI